VVGERLRVQQYVMADSIPEQPTFSPSLDRLPSRSGGAGCRTNRSIFCLIYRRKSLTARRMAPTRPLSDLPRHAYPADIYGLRGLLMRNTVRSRTVFLPASEDKSWGRNPKEQFEAVTDLT
jgi:hypothetical protein